LDARFFFQNPIPNVGLFDQFSSYAKNAHFEVHTDCPVFFSESYTKRWSF